MSSVAATVPSPSSILPAAELTQGPRRQSTCRRHQLLFWLGSGWQRDAWLAWRWCSGSGRSPR